MLQGYKRTSVIISVALFLLASASVIYLMFPHLSSDDSGFVAEIYQEGRLLFRIPLNEVTENDSFIIKGKDGCTNQIEVRPGSIGIISADCPDKLCVRQGFVTDSRLPVVCLPNRLVIQLRPASEVKTQEPISPDIITY